MTRWAVLALAVSSLLAWPASSLGAASSLVVVEAPACFPEGLSEDSLRQALAIELKAQSRQLLHGDSPPADSRSTIRIRLLNDDCSSTTAKVSVLLGFVQSGRDVQLRTAVQLDDTVPALRARTLAIAIAELLSWTETNPWGKAGERGRVTPEDGPSGGALPSESPPPTPATPPAPVPPPAALEPAPSHATSAPSLDWGASALVQGTRVNGHSLAGVGLQGEGRLWANWWGAGRLASGKLHLSSDWGPVQLRWVEGSLALQYQVGSLPWMRVGPCWQLLGVRAQGESRAAIPEAAQHLWWSWGGGQVALSAPISGAWRLLGSADLGWGWGRAELTAGGKPILSLEGAVARIAFGVGYGG